MMSTEQQAASVAMSQGNVIIQFQSATGDDTGGWLLQCPVPPCAILAHWLFQCHPAHASLPGPGHSTRHWR